MKTTTKLSPQHCRLIGWGQKTNNDREEKNLENNNQKCKYMYLFKTEQRIKINKQGKNYLLIRQINNKHSSVSLFLTTEIDTSYNIV